MADWCCKNNSRQRQRWPHWQKAYWLVIHKKAEVLTSSSFTYFTCKTSSHKTEFCCYANKSSYLVNLHTLQQPGYLDRHDVVKVTTQTFYRLHMRALPWEQTIWLLGTAIMISGNKSCYMGTSPGDKWERDSLYENQSWRSCSLLQWCGVGCADTMSVSIDSHQHIILINLYGYFRSNIHKETYRIQCHLGKEDNYQLTSNSQVHRLMGGGCHNYYTSAGMLCFSCIVLVIVKKVRLFTCGALQ